MSVKPTHISIMLSFKGNFLSFCEFLLKPKASGPILGLKGQGFELNILKNWRIRRSLQRSAKPSHFTIMLNFIGGMRAYCANTKRIDFLFFCGSFLKNKRLLELVLCPGDGVLSSIYWKTNEKVVISH